MTARNRKALERSVETDREIQIMLEQHPPLARPLTAKRVQARLTRRLSLRAIRWHLHRLRVAEDTLPMRQATD